MAVVLCPWLALSTGYAQEPRLRTLKHDPTRQTWVEVAPPADGTPAGDLLAIRAMIKSRSYARAMSATKRFIKKHGKDDPLYPEVLLAQVQVFVARREYTAASKLLKNFFNEYAGVTATPDALRLKFIVAEAYLGGAKKKVWGIFRVSGEDDALTMLDEISTDYTDEPVAELAVKTKADHLYRTGEHALAELDYARMVRDYPRSRYTQFAMRRSADAALASFAGVDYDDAALIEAEQRYNDYLRRFAGAADRDDIGLLLDTIHASRADKVYSIGAYYERTEHYGSAVYYYRKVALEFPNTIAATSANARLELLGAPLNADAASEG